MLNSSYFARVCLMCCVFMCFLFALCVCCLTHRRLSDIFRHTHGEWWVRIIRLNGDGEREEAEKRHAKQRTDRQTCHDEVK